MQWIIHKLRKTFLRHWKSRAALTMLHAGMRPPVRQTRSSTFVDANLPPLAAHGSASLLRRPRLRPTDSKPRVRSFHARLRVKPHPDFRLGTMAPQPPLACCLLSRMVRSGNRPGNWKWNAQRETRCFTLGRSCLKTVHGVALASQRKSNCSANTLEKGAAPR